MSKKEIAILCSDIHLSHRAPIARSAEPNWYEAMARTLNHLKVWSINLNVPIICAGDVFDKWDSCPELINWAIDNVPKMYAVPGQHDLPHHRLDDIKQSAFYTLVKTGNIEVIPRQSKHGPMIITTPQNQDIAIVGFPWGESLSEYKDKSERRKNEVRLAVAHNYCWYNDFKFTGAEEDYEEHEALALVNELRGFDVALFGDNHKSFTHNPEQKETPIICNPGSLMLRNINQKKTKATFGLLYSDGSVVIKKFPTKDDKWTSMEEEITLVEEALKIAKPFIRELYALGEDVYDFRTAVEKYCKKNVVDKTVASLLSEILEHASEKD